MLAGTETSLTYEININFTNKPQNLKLYIDESMQNELYIENDVLSLKDFLSLEDEKEVSKIIYWNWAEETGDTEEEIYENDLKDSEFMGKKLQMAISVTGKQAMSANNNHYMVTLDANGGKIGSSESVQKQVTCGDSYGDLPIPTREGYTFVGWAEAVKDDDKTGKLWGSELTSNEFVKNKFKTNTEYILEYDIALNEGIPEEYEIMQSVQWGNIDIRILNEDGSYNSTYSIGGHNKLYSQCGDNYVIGKKYHVKTNISTPEDLSNTVISYYTALCQKVQNTKVIYSISGTFSNIIFYINVSQDTIVTENSSSMLTAIWEAE